MEVQSQFLSSITKMHRHGLGGQSNPCDLLAVSTSFVDTEEWRLSVSQFGDQTGRQGESRQTDRQTAGSPSVPFLSKLPLSSSDPYDSSSGSLQLLSIKPVVAQPNYSHPASSDRSQDSAVVNGEVTRMHTNTQERY